MEKKIKSLQACVVILAIALCACIYKINALESNIKNLDNAFDRQYQQVTNQVQSIYQNVDEKLREEASLLSSVEAEYGEFDLENHTIDVTVKLVPKLISEEMKVQVSINGRTAELSRTGNSFTGTVPVDIYNIGELMLLTIDTAAGTQTQYLSEIQVEYLWAERIPSLYYCDISGNATFADGKYTLNGHIDINCSPVADTPDVKFESFVLVTELNGKESSGNCLSVTEYWGDISTPEGQILENMLITVVEDEFMVRFERNPYCINPFIYACIIEDPSTGRGISPLRAAVEISKFSSRILNKQLDALSLIMNPPYLAPKGSFQGEQKVTPGKIIEYDVSLMPEKPIPLSFEKALLGWDFIKFFKTETESVTGVFRNMSGDLRTDKRTATEVSYSVSGQAARLNSLLDSISRKIIIPIVERVADISAVFKIGSETIAVKAQDGTVSFSEITEEIRGGNYMYKYGDRKAMLERKYKLQELINTISSFSKLPEVANKINWMECFKFVLEQYGIENVTNFIATE